MAMQATPLGSTKTRFRLTERQRENIAFLLFILPNTFLLVMWVYYPFVYSFYLSLTSWNLLSANINFVGLQNYINLLQNPAFHQVVFNTVVFTLGTVFVRLAISLGLAILLNQNLFLRSLWRLIIFSPHITTSAAMALVWLSMYDPNYGPLSALFSLFGLDFPNVMASTELALPALIVVAIWKGLGFSTIVFLAALQSVSADLLDAASVDGASAWQSFWAVTFPAISPVTYFLVVTGMIGAFQTFDIVSVMTGGGPVNSTNLYVYSLYREAFHYNRMGYASAIAVIFFIVMMIFTFVQTRIANRWVTYS
ncbi:MAG: sugar ABC transporter permease [Anaerolineales bacterium]|nr:sugar ABC transporter permease [Anaerolineales bacterium]